MSESTEVAIGTVTVRGREFPVTLDRFWAFTATVGPVKVSAANKPDLEAKISREITRQKIEHKIEVVLDHEGRYIRATLRGQHERTKQTLFTLASGEKVSVEYPKLVALGGQVTDADIAEMNRLAQDARAAEKVHRAFIQAKAPSRDVPAVWQLIRDAEAVAIEAAGQA